MSERFDHDEFISISRELEKHHSIFDRLWSMGKPVFSESVSTATVYFDSVGETIDFKINPKFWSSLNGIQKQFIISHECLHVVLYHGFRINELKGTKLKIANYALDIVVNHSLVDKFGFKRSEIDPENKYCWVDTVFKDNITESGKYFEFYYNLLTKLIQESASGSSGQQGDFGKLVDDHEGLDSFNTPEFQNKMKDLIPSEELESLSDFVDSQTSDIEGKCQKAGCSPGKTFAIVNIDKVKNKKKWETVIKKWINKHIKDNEVEQWARPNRRLSFISDDFMIPSDQEVENFEKDRIQVFFYQDASGSCKNLSKRFFAAAKSLPKDKFDIKLFSFDTKVYETSIESGKIYGSGGTSFSCIEKHIQEYIKKHNLNYPKAVFCITDGWSSDYINPEKPKNWYWFLSTDYTRCIPKECNVFSLKDYE